MEDVAIKHYEPNGAIIDIEWDEAVYDCFVFNNKKIVVLKNEQFDEFLEDKKLEYNEKNIMLGEVFSKNDVDYIFSLTEEEYESALKYYLTLKNAFLGVVDD